MRILPVLDIMAGQVVRGIGGRRHEYRPVVSRLTSSCRPADVARAFRDAFGLHELYLADLGALAGAPPALPIYAELQALGFDLWVDAGIREASTAAPLAATAIRRIVVGLETATPGAVADACQKWGGHRVVFSLDLTDGKPLGSPAADAWSIATQAIADGVRCLIVLDLARVGTGAGVGTERLCRRLVEAYPGVEVVAGGGVCGVADVNRLKDLDVAAVLVASALHDGRLRPEDLANL
ncbi:MAG TPA: HisA/HisF-related TIM barrel protein [Gemmataceae bacterium]|jgi:phosphoribosylformimino-5-aminoimidazole carboxamide ribotide isomerase|nr:HisA/HisF-related TIM barrel protein [Gemmataceae bacterium]